MKIAVVGGGITGLTAAYELAKQGYEVVVFEREPVIGGLAYGFTTKSWNWYLEGAYHHLFTNDRAIIDLSRELGIGDRLIVKRPVTANYWHDRMYQFDSPAHLLSFPGLSLPDKLRTGALAAFCKVYPFWSTLEGITAKQFFIRWGGVRAWNIIWEPLMTGKFGHLDGAIAASWLWARIHKRTPSLYYYDGGFQTFIQTLADAVVKYGGTIHTAAGIGPITRKRTKSGNGFLVQGTTFDRVLITTPTVIADRLLPGIAHREALTIPHLHAQVLILETEQPILKDVYWLSVTDRQFPFLAVVAHTNFMDKKQYGGRHITYVGNYLPEGHRYLSMTKRDLLSEFAPFIQRLNPAFRLSAVRESYLFFGPYAQPVHERNYSAKAPKLVSAIPGAFLANMDSIFPWDRGTNYAVELGQRAASTILASAR